MPFNVLLNLRVIILLVARWAKNLKIIFVIRLIIPLIQIPFSHLVELTCYHRSKRKVFPSISRLIHGYSLLINRLLGNHIWLLWTVLIWWVYTCLNRSLLIRSLVLNWSSHIDMNLLWVSGKELILTSISI
jgi:hypothetical protein